MATEPDFSSMTDDEIYAYYGVDNPNKAQTAQTTQSPNADMAGAISAALPSENDLRGETANTQSPAQNQVPAPAPLSQDEWDAVNAGVVDESTSPVAEGFKTFFGSLFTGQGRKDAMDNYREQTRGGGKAAKTAGYLSDLGNAFYQGLLGGASHLTEAAGNLTGWEDLVDASRQYRADLAEYAPTNMTDTGAVDENGVARRQSWGDKVAETGKDVMRIMGEFAPAAASGGSTAVARTAGTAATWGLVGAGGVNTGFDIYRTTVENAEQNGFSKAQAAGLGIAGGAIDAFANAFLMGKFLGKGAKPIEEKFFQTFIKRQLGGALKTGAMMGASGGAQNVIQQLAENGEVNLEATGDSIVDAVIQGAMFHLMNGALHSPLEWSQYRTARAVKGDARNRDAAAADERATEKMVADELEAHTAESVAIESARKVLGDEQGAAMFCERYGDAAKEFIAARMRGVDVPVEAAKDIGDLAKAFQTQEDMNAFGDRLMQYMNDAYNAKVEQRARWDENLKNAAEEETEAKRKRENGVDEAGVNAVFGIENQNARPSDMTRDSRIPRRINQPKGQANTDTNENAARVLADADRTHEDGGRIPRRIPALRGQSGTEVNEDAMRVAAEGDAVRENRIPRRVNQPRGNRAEEGDPQTVARAEEAKSADQAADEARAFGEDVSSPNEDYAKYFEWLGGREDTDAMRYAFNREQEQDNARRLIHEMTRKDEAKAEPAKEEVEPKPAEEPKPAPSPAEPDAKTETSAPEAPAPEAPTAVAEPAKKSPLRRMVDAINAKDVETGRAVEEELRGEIRAGKVPTEAEIEAATEGMGEAGKNAIRKYIGQMEDAVEAKANEATSKTDTATSETDAAPAKTEAEVREDAYNAWLKRQVGKNGKPKKDSRAMRAQFDKMATDGKVDAKTGDDVKAETDAKPAEPTTAQSPSAPSVSDKAWRNWLGTGRDGSPIELSPAEEKASKKLFADLVKAGKVDGETGEAIAAKETEPAKEKPAEAKPVATKESKPESKAEESAPASESPSAPSADMKALGEAAKAAQKELGSLAMKSDAELMKHRAMLENAKRADKVKAIDDLLAYRAAAKEAKPKVGGKYAGSVDEDARRLDSRTVGEASSDDPALLDRLGQRMAKLVPGVKVRVGELSEGAKRSGATAEFDPATGEVVVSPDAPMSDVVHEIGGHGTLEWAKRNAPALYSKCLEYVRTAPKDVKDFVYENYRDFADRPDKIVHEIFAQRFARENGAEFQKLLEEPKARKWWTNVVNAVRSVFQDAAKRNGVDTSKLRGMDAQGFMKGVAEQMAMGRELNRWTAFGRDAKYLDVDIEPVGGAKDKGVLDARAKRGDLIESNIRLMLKHPGVYNENDAYHFAYSAHKGEIAFFKDNGDLTFDILIRRPLSENGIAEIEKFSHEYRNGRNGDAFDSSLEKARNALRLFRVDNGRNAPKETPKSGDGGLAVGQPGERPGKDTWKGNATGKKDLLNSRRNDLVQGFTRSEEYDGKLYSRVHDKKIIDEFKDDDKTITLFRAVKVGPDGSVRPPQSSQDKAVGDTKYKDRPAEGYIMKDGRIAANPDGTDEMPVFAADERIDLANPKVGGKGEFIRFTQKDADDGKCTQDMVGELKYYFDLIKGKGTDPRTGKSIKTTDLMGVLYDPYYHTSDTPFNDQFSSAWSRPDWKVIEVKILKSDLESGYRAERAGLTVGQHVWNGGSVDSSLPKGMKRNVFLTRYAQLVRVVPEAEAAKFVDQKWASIKNRMVLDAARMTPQMRDEMAKLGWRITDSDSYKSWADARRKMMDLSAKLEVAKEKGNEKRVNMLKDMVDKATNELERKTTEYPVGDHSGMPRYEDGGDVGNLDSRAAKQYDERIEDGRKFNEKYADADVSRTGRGGLGRVGDAIEKLDAGQGEVSRPSGEAVLRAAREDGYHLGTVDEGEKLYARKPFRDGETEKHGMETLHVYRDGDTVYKYRRPEVTPGTELEKVRRHNELFGDRTGYEVVGVAETEDGRPSIVLKQPYVDFVPKSGNIARKQLESDLRRRFGKVEVSEDGTEMRAGGWIVDDLKDANVGLDAKTGRYAVIDALVHRAEDFGGKAPKMETADGGERGGATVIGPGVGGGAEGERLYARSAMETAKDNNDQIDGMRSRGNNDDVVKYSRMEREYDTDNVLYHYGKFGVKSVSEENPFVIKADGEGFHVGTLEAAKGRMADQASNLEGDLVDVVDGPMGKVFNEKFESDPFGLADMLGRRISKLFLRKGMKFYDSYDVGEGWRKVIEKAKSLGYNGIRYRNNQEDAGSYSYVVWNPSDVKIADSKTFDDAGVDIPYERRGDVNNDNALYSRQAHPIDHARLQANGVDDAAHHYMDKEVSKGDRSILEFVKSKNFREGLSEMYFKNMADRFRPVRNVIVDSKMAENMTRQEAEAWADNDKASPYHQLRVLSGKTETNMKRMEAIFNDLKDDLKGFRDLGIDVDDLSVFSYAKHAPKRNAQKDRELVAQGKTPTGTGSGISDALANDIASGRQFTLDGGATMKQYTPEQLKALQGAHDRLVKRMNAEFGLKYMHDHGLIDRDSMNRMLGAYGIEHVNLRDEIKGGAPVSPSMPTIGKPVKNAKGRSSALEDNAIVHSVSDTFNTIANAIKNDAAESLARYVEQHPEMGEVRVKTPTDRVDEAMVEFRRNNPVKDASGKVVGEKNQQMVVVLYGKRGVDLSHAFREQDVVHALPFIQKVSRGWASFATQLSPTFSARNFMKDTVEVALDTIATDGPMAAAKFLKNQATLMPLWNREFRRVFNEYSKTGRVVVGDGASDIARYFKEYVESGALIGGGAREGYGKTERSLKEVSKELAGIEKGVGKVAKVWEWYKEKVGKVNESIEMLTRFSNYYNRRANLGESVEKAAINSREASTDFGMYGDQRYLNSIFTFSNSILGGTMRATKSMMKNKWGRTLAVGMVAMGMLEEFLNSDDDDKSSDANGGKSNTNVSEYERENGFRLRVGDKYVRIPTHLGPWSVLKYLGGNMARAAMGQISWDKAAGNVRDSATTMLSHFSGTGEHGFGKDSPSLINSFTPSVLQPFVQIASNEDYKGEKIHREHDLGDAKYAPDFKYAKKGTGAVWVGLSRALNNIPFFSGGSDLVKGRMSVPPEDIEYLAKQIVKNFGTDVVNTALLPATAYNVATGEEELSDNLRNIPLVKDFLKDMPDITKRYYEAKDRHAEEGQAFKNSEPKGKAAYLREHPTAAMNLGKLESSIKNLSAMLRGEIVDKNGKVVGTYEPTEAKKQSIRKVLRKQMANYVRIVERKRR